VTTDDFSQPDPAFMSCLDQLWTAEQFHTLNTLGVYLDMIRETYQYLGTLTPIVFRRFGSDEHHQTIMREVAISCGLTGRWSELKSNKLVGEAQIQILASPVDSEALCVAQVMRDMIQHQTLFALTVVRNLDGAEQHIASTRSAVVILTRGILHNPDFARVILALNDACLKFVTVQADVSFDFPGPGFYESILKEGLGTKDVGPQDGPKLVEAYQSLINVMALGFSPAGSIGIQQRQVEEICRRLQVEVKTQRTLPFCYELVGTPKDSQPIDSLACVSPIDPVTVVPCAPPTLTVCFPAVPAERTKLRL